MDPKISGKLPEFIVYDIGNKPDLSGGKKAEKMFIGSRIGQINVNGKKEDAVIFYRVPISKLGNLQSRQTRSEAKQAARNAIEHFQKMLVKGGATENSAAQATNAFLIPDERLSKSALDLALFERIAVVNIKIPVITTDNGSMEGIQPHAKILEEARARSKQKVASSGIPAAPLSAKSSNLKTSKPLPTIPQNHKGKSVGTGGKPLPPTPSKPPLTNAIPQAPGNPSVSGIQPKSEY